MHGNRNFTPKLTYAAFSAFFALLAAHPSFSDAGAEKMSIQLAFQTHLDHDLPEQDVYIEREAGSGEVYRVTVGDHDMNARLYTAEEMVPHNPFDPAAVGPYKMGKPLGMTLGQWLRQRGTGTYTYSEGVGTIELKFENLVPNGVYTIWHSFIALPPPEPFTGALDLPLGARDGSESVFHADENGRAHFVHTFRPGLEFSDVWTTSMVAINYHSDGKTYRGHPGEFGRYAHVPLFAMLPKRAGIE